jgi:hypothetical protein
VGVLVALVVSARWIRAIRGSIVSDAGKFTRSTANSMPSRDMDQPMVAVGFWEHLDSNPHCHVLVAASDDTSDHGYWYIAVLGSPDDQELAEKAEAYCELVEADSQHRADCQLEAVLGARNTQPRPGLYQRRPRRIFSKVGGDGYND